MKTGSLTIDHRLHILQNALRGAGDLIFSADLSTQDGEHLEALLRLLADECERIGEEAEARFHEEGSSGVRTADAREVRS